MRWRRTLLFAAIVIAHLLVVRFFPADRTTPPDAPGQEISFATLSSTAPSERVSQTRPIPKAIRAHKFNKGPASLSQVQPDKPADTAPAPVDWAQEAELAAADSLKLEAEASRQAAALSQWQLRVMPSPKAPAASGFSWDHSRTHRLESSAQGLVVNLNDRCSILISLSLMAVLGGCKIGQIPVHGDLFMHMRDAPEAGP
ncbi:MAG TPA: hypothetical protein VK696_01070 [Steroidobacteraceae bacterium]|jgi:hypothetical protein|nr:hypothetical protein [Steroidobacteraceae bacterium]